jgi:hypothetical protein
MTTLQIKRGDTLDLDCRVYEYAGGPALNLSGWTIRSQVRKRSGALVEVLVVTITDAAQGRYTLSAPAAKTALWTPDQARMDIEYTDPSGVVQSTETTTLDIIADVTR